MIFVSEQLDVPSAQAPDEQVVAFFRQFLPDFYFVNTPLSRMRRHLELLRALPQQSLQIEFHSPPGAQFTEMMLCAHDAATPGLLAGIAGALAALKINVHTAWIHTLYDPHDPGAQVILDTLILSENYLRRTRPLSHKTQDALAQSLREIMTPPLPSPSDSPALPIALETLELSAAGPYTLIKIAAPDDAGVLHRVAQAVAQLNLDITHAQINTFENAAADIFFVTDTAGHPLSPARFGDVQAQLREFLAL